MLDYRYNPLPCDRRVSQTLVCHSVKNLGFMKEIPGKYKSINLSLKMMINQIAELVNHLISFHLLWLLQLHIHIPRRSLRHVSLSFVPGISQFVFQELD